MERKVAILWGRIVGAVVLTALLGGCSRVASLHIYNAYPRPVSVLLYSDQPVSFGAKPPVYLLSSEIVLPKQEVVSYLSRDSAIHLDIYSPSKVFLRRVRLSQAEIEQAYEEYAPMSVTVGPTRTVISKAGGTKLDNTGVYLLFVIVCLFPLLVFVIAGAVAFVSVVRIVLR